MVCDSLTEIEPKFEKLVSKSKYNSNQILDIASEYKKTQEKINVSMREYVSLSMCFIKEIYAN